MALTMAQTCHVLKAVTSYLSFNRKSKQGTFARWKRSLMEINKASIVCLCGYIGNMRPGRDIRLPVKCTVQRGYLYHLSFSAYRIPTEWLTEGLLSFLQLIQTPLTTENGTSQVKPHWSDNLHWLVYTNLVHIRDAFRLIVNKLKVEN